MMPKKISSEARAGGISGSSHIGSCDEGSPGSSGFPADQDALIHPIREPGEEPVAPTVILTFTQPDYQALCRLIQAREMPRHIWGCACRLGSWEDAALTVAAPALGAPYAAMVLEKLIALGARRVLALGWCGSLTPQVRIGDLILPNKAIPGDGTSPHYCPEPGGIPPHPGLYDLLAASLRTAEVPWHAGPVWSTDAFYRETKGLVKSCQEQGILGIDLELAALFAVARFRGIAMAGLLVVSDELFTLTWQPARGSQPFRLAREKALQSVLEVAAHAGGSHETSAKIM
jgi:uridine phosphorylase